MHYEYYFCQHVNDALLKYLKENGIPHKVSDFGGLVPNLVSFTLKDKSEHLEAISHYTDTYPIISIHYSPKEISSAEFLWLWPKKQTICIVNEDEECLSQRCSGGKIHFLEPSPAMRIAKEPSTSGHCGFWTHDTGFALLFADSRIKEICESKELKGIKFHKVLLRKGNPSEKLFRLDSDHILPFEALAPGHGETTRRCPHCGYKRVIDDNRYQLHLKAGSIDPELDFCMTAPFWGEGFSRPNYIISQRFYRLLQENKLTAGIRVSPVVFV